ncbi:hypothetical protein B0H10DRAFT_2241123 [Mycena sp. CBHHK59/15]|nr:hypothetical protein B0H10DRAFT_2241123 [Mycena sp. CBHHK59/15]
MAAGTSTAYKLDLEDMIAFPDAGHVPVFPPNPGESWIIFGEIVKDNSIMRPVYRVRDKIDCQFPVAFYTDNPSEDAKDCKVGHVLCITTACAMPSRTGRMGTESRIQAPCTPVFQKTFRALNQRLREKSDRGEILLCNFCKKPSTQSCAKCTTRYCSKECQGVDWKEKGHKKECPVISRLHVWNLTDWG